MQNKYNVQFCLNTAPNAVPGISLGLFDTENEAKAAVQAINAALTEMRIPIYTVTVPPGMSVNIRPNKPAAINYEPELLTLREIYERYGTEGRHILCSQGEAFPIQVFVFQTSETFSYWDLSEGVCDLEYTTRKHPELRLQVLDYFELDGNTSIGQCTCDFVTTILVTGCICGSIVRYGSTG